VAGTVRTKGGWCNKALPQPTGSHACCTQSRRAPGQQATAISPGSGHCEDHYSSYGADPRVLQQRRGRVVCFSSAAGGSCASAVPRAGRVLQQGRGTP